MSEKSYKLALWYIRVRASVHQDMSPTLMSGRVDLTHGYYVVAENAEEAKAKVSPVAERALAQYREEGNFIGPELQALQMPLNELRPYYRGASIFFPNGEVCLSLEKDEREFDLEVRLVRKRKK